MVLKVIFHYIIPKIPYIYIYKLIYQIIINNITYTLKNIFKLFRFGVKQCIHELVRIKFLQIIDGLTDSDILDRH